MCIQHRQLDAGCSRLGGVNYELGLCILMLQMQSLSPLLLIKLKFGFNLLQIHSSGSDLIS